MVGDIKLGLWLKNQRGDYRAGIIPPHRIEAFKEIDMMWDVKSVSRTSFPEQAIFYYFSKIFPDTIHRHTDLGFEFDVYIPSLKVAIEYDGATWHKKARTVNKDIEKNNFCRDNNISLFRIRENSLELYSTCICYSVSGREYITLENAIFEIFKNLNISNIKRVDLNIKRDFQDIHFLYREHSSKEWRAGLLATKKYYDTNGHLIVPALYVDEDGFRLGQWLIVQRRHYNNHELPPKKIQKLEELGMLWISKLEYYWLQTYEVVKEYYIEHGNLEITYSRKVKGKHLRKWLENQKEKYEQQKL
jgi:hypothetical protein